MESRPIRWIPPEPRKGLAGVLDKFVGPGATRAEIVLQFGGRRSGRPVGGAVSGLSTGRPGKPPWPPCWPWT